MPENSIVLEPHLMRFRLSDGEIQIPDPVATWIAIEKAIGALIESGTVSYGTLVPAIRRALCMDGAPNRAVHLHLPSNGAPETRQDVDLVSDSNVVAVYLYLQRWADDLGKSSAPTPMRLSEPATGASRTA